MKVELVKMRTILELTGGKFSKLPWKIVSTVRSSIAVANFLQFFFFLFFTKNSGLKFFPSDRTENSKKTEVDSLIFRSTMTKNSSKFSKTLSTIPEKLTNFSKTSFSGFSVFKIFTTFFHFSSRFFSSNFCWLFQDVPKFDRWKYPGNFNASCYFQQHLFT